MTECIVCYEDIKNNVSLECTHELCLNCFVNTLKAKNKFSCPMCRHKYNFYLKDEEQVFEVSEDYVFETYNSSYEIDIVQEQQSVFQELLTNCYPDHIYKYYRTTLNGNIYCFIIMFSINIEEDIEMNDNDVISHLLSNLLADIAPLNNVTIEMIRESSVQLENHKLISADCYLENIHDIRPTTGKFLS